MSNSCAIRIGRDSLGTVLYTASQLAVVLLLIFRTTPEELGSFGMDQGTRVISWVLILDSIDNGFDMASQIVGAARRVANYTILGDALVEDGVLELDARLNVREFSR